MEVARKDGLLLVRELAAEVKNHMDFKINAVMVSGIPTYVTKKYLFSFSSSISITQLSRFAVEFNF